MALLVFILQKSLKNKMGNGALCQAITTPDVFAKLGLPLQQMEKFLQQYPKIRQIVQDKFDQEITQACLKYDTRKFSQGIYIGSVNNNTIPHTNEKNPKGIFLNQAGFFHFGQMKNGMRQGNGLLIDEDGEYYNGKWSQNSPNGQGQYFSLQLKRSYKGKWIDGVQSGQGTESYQDGSSYVGQFLNGLKQGKGRLRYPDGTFYEGQFKQNTINGYGISESKFHKYEGEWMNGKMHGNGISTWNNQKGEVIGSYVGQYKEGLKHGYGEYKWGEKKIYKGMWEDGDMKSQGVLLNYQ